MECFGRPVTIVIAALMLAGTAGCMPQLLPSLPPAASTYDFGPLPGDAAPPLLFHAELAALDAPSWLNGPDIRYRRLDEQPGVLRAYSQNQWVADMPELFEQRLRHRLAQAAPPASGRSGLLHVEILSFEQVFVEPDEAHVIALARATFEDAGGRPHRRDFESRRPSSPDVEGATRGLPAVADEVIDAIMAWLRGIDTQRSE